jgi:hypothetical protein
MLLLGMCVGLVALALPPHAMAIDLDGIKVTPSIAYTGEYDDNLYRTQFNKRSDYVNTFSPGIAVEATPGNHSIKAGYKLDILKYTSHTNFDTYRHHADLVGIFKFNRVELRLKEDFRKTDDFPTSELTKRVKRNENFLSGGVDYDFIERWGIGLDFIWGDINNLHPDFDFLDRRTYTFATNIYYRITAKTRVFAEYDFVRELYRYDHTRTNNRYRGLIGVRGDLTERFNVTGKAGYEHLTFHTARNDQDNFVTSIEANYKPVERLGIGLILKRSVENSTFTNNAQYETFSSNLVLTYNFTPKLTILPRGSLGVDQYRESVLNIDRMEKRVDYNYGGGLGIRYTPQKWVVLEGGYDFTRRDSNFNTNDYDDNRVSFTVTLSM